MEVRAPYPAEIRSLTSLRYLAAIWVVLFHWTGYFPESLLRNAPVVREGFLGVDFFFVLSGFILCHVYLARQADGRLDYWNFVSRRIARIYPMHVLTLGAMIAFGVIAHRYHLTFAGPWIPDEFFALGSGEVPREAMAQLLLIHAWGASDGLHFNAPSWSISAELFAYLMFPLFTYGLHRAGERPAAVLAAVILLIMLYSLALEKVAHREVFEMTWNIGVLRIIPDFLYGVALYRLGTSWSAGRTRSALLLLAGVAAVLAGVVLELPFCLVVLGLGVVILACADAERCGLLAPMKTDFAVLLGEVSYSVYMLHFPFGIALFGLVLKDHLDVGLAGEIGLLALGMAAVSVLAWAAHRWFEIPLRNRLNAGASSVMAKWQRAEP